MYRKQNYLIIVAGGRGQRMGLDFNKVFAKVGDLPLLYWTILHFEKSSIVDKIIISASEADTSAIRSLVKKHGFEKVVDVVSAQKTRQDSIYAVLKKFKDVISKEDLVGVHNGANPFVNSFEIKKVFEAARKYGASLLAQIAKDTVKVADKSGFVANTPLRKYSWYAQTPQVATFGKLFLAHKKAKEARFAGTDDAQLLERIKVKVKIVPCSAQNIKITFREDLQLAKEILKSFIY